MIKIDRELDRVLALLRNKVRDQGFTQMEVQEVLGWGRSYISQLLTKQKTLRIDQILLILSVIGVDPAAFFSELYGGPPSSRPLIRAKGRRLPRAGARAPGSEVSRQELERLKALINGVTDLLREKGFITTTDLSEAVKSARRE